jgi:hypothetical protein
MQVFRFSRGFKVPMYFCFAFFCLAVAGYATYGFLATNRRETYLGAMGIALFGTFAVVVLHIIRKLDDQVEVDETAITYVSRNGDHLRMPWSDIRRVVPREKLQRLELYDFTNRSMRLEYQIEDFSVLRTLIEEHLRRLLEASAQQTTFRKSTANLVSWLAIAAFWLIPVCAGLATGSRQLVVLGVVFIVVWLIPLASTPNAVRLTEDAIEVRYPFRTHKLKFEDIRDISVKDFHSRGNTIATAVVSLDGNKTVGLSQFRDGHLVLHRALRSAWEKAMDRTRKP